MANTDITMTNYSKYFVDQARRLLAVYKTLNLMEIQICVTFIL